MEWGANMAVHHTIMLQTRADDQLPARPSDLSEVYAGVRTALRAVA